MGLFSSKVAPVASVLSEALAWQDDQDGQLAGTGTTGYGTPLTMALAPALPQSSSPSRKLGTVTTAAATATPSYPVVSNDECQLFGGDYQRLHARVHKLVLVVRNIASRSQTQQQQQQKQLLHQQVCVAIDSVLAMVQAVIATGDLSPSSVDCGVVDTTVNELINSIQSVIIKPDLYYIALSLVYILSRVMIHVNYYLLQRGAKDFKSRHQWSSEIDKIMTTVSNAKKFQMHPKTSMGAVCFELSKVDSMVRSLKDPQESSKALTAALQFTVGLVKSAATMTVDQNLLAGAGQGLQIGISYARRKFAGQVSGKLTRMQQLSASILFRFKQCDPTLSAIHLVTELYNQDVKDSRRWEVWAGYAVMVTEVILGITATNLMFEMCIKDYNRHESSSEIRLPALTATQSIGLPSDDVGSLKVQCDSALKQSIFSSSPRKLASIAPDINSSETHMMPTVAVGSYSVTLTPDRCSQILACHLKGEELCKALWQGGTSVVECGLLQLISHGDARTIHEHTVDNFKLKVARWAESLFSENTTSGPEDNGGLQGWLHQGMALIYDEFNNLSQEALVPLMASIQRMERLFGQNPKAVPSSEASSEATLAVLDDINWLEDALQLFSSESVIAEALLKSCMQRLSIVEAGLAAMVMLVDSFTIPLLPPLRATPSSSDLKKSSVLTHALLLLDSVSAFLTTQPPLITPGTAVNLGVPFMQQCNLLLFLGAFCRSKRDILESCHGSNSLANETGNPAVSLDEIIRQLCSSKVPHTDDCGRVLWVSIYDIVEQLQDVLQRAMMELEHQPSLKVVDLGASELDQYASVILQSKIVLPSHRATDSVGAAMSISTTVSDVLMRFQLHSSACMALLYDALAGELKAIGDNQVDGTAGNDLAKGMGLLSSHLTTVTATLRDTLICIEHFDASFRLDCKTKIQDGLRGVIVKLKGDLIATAPDHTHAVASEGFRCDNNLNHVQAHFTATAQPLLTRLQQELVKELVALPLAPLPTPLMDLLKSLPSSGLLVQLQGCKSALVSCTSVIRDSAIAELEHYANELAIPTPSTGQLSSSIGKIVSNITEKWALPGSNDTVGIGNMMHDLVGDSGLISQVVGDLTKAARGRMEHWRVREIAAFCVKRLQAQPSHSSPILADQVQGAILKRRSIETVEGVQKVLRSDTSTATMYNEIVMGIYSRSDSIDNDNADATEASVWAEHEASIAKGILQRIELLENVRQAIATEIDPTKRQEMLVKCRLEQRALKIASSNIKDVGKKLDIVIEFIDNIDGHLTEIDGKLDNLQADVSQLREQLKLLIGRPYLEIVEEYATKIIHQSASQLPTSVYIEGLVCGSGSKNDFCEDPIDNPSVPVGQAFTNFMLSDKSVLLVSGVAGSGKSTAVERMKLYVVGEYAELRKREANKTVILIHISLPTIKDPLGNLFEEGVHLAFRESLRAEQIQQMRDDAQKPKSHIELVFFLDAYDELRPEALMKNLWRCNNLEQYRDATDPTVALGYPKVLITSRMELLSDKGEEYIHSFLPIESESEAKKTPEGAAKYFRELRFLSFGDKRGEYQRQYVALKWRDTFRQTLKCDSGKKTIMQRMCKTRDEISKICSAAIKERSYYGYSIDDRNDTSDAAFERSNNAEISNLVNEANARVEQMVDVVWLSTVSEPPPSISNPASTTAKAGINPANVSSASSKCVSVKAGFDEFLSNLNAWLDCLQESLLSSVRQSAPQLSSAESTAACMVACLAACNGLSRADDNERRLVIEFLHTNLSLDSNLWLQERYDKEFRAIPELKELVSTPFMMQVVTEVLQTLKNSQRTILGELKGSLVVILGETLAELVWGRLRSTKVLSELPDIQADLDKPSSDPEYQKRREQLLAVAKAVTKALPELPSDVPGQTRELMLLTNTNANAVQQIDRIAVRNRIGHYLVLILRRPATRRFAIYECFIHNYTDREVCKALYSRTSTALDPASLKLEAAEFSRRLALYMTWQGQTKLQMRKKSNIFNEKPNAMDIFFSAEPLVAAARHAAPVRSEGGFLSFIHKTIQEYYCADALVVGLEEIVKSRMMSVEELLKIISDLAAYEEARRVARQTQTQTPTQSLVGAINNSDIRRMQSTFESLVRDLLESQLAILPITDELAVLDFLIDCILDSVEVSAYFRLVYAIAVTYRNLSTIRAISEASSALTATSGGGVSTMATAAGGSLDIVAENLEAIATKQIPQRRNRTLLHESAYAGLETASMFAIDIFNRSKVAVDINLSPSAPQQPPRLEEQLINTMDDDLKSPLYRAAEAGHTAICTLLLDNDADPSAQIRGVELLQGRRLSELIKMNEKAQHGAVTTCRPLLAEAGGGNNKERSGTAASPSAAPNNNNGNNSTGTASANHNNAAIFDEFLIGSPDISISNADEDDDSIVQSTMTPGKVTVYMFEVEVKETLRPIIKPQQKYNNHHPITNINHPSLSVGWCTTGSAAGSDALLTLVGNHPQSIGLNIFTLACTSNNQEVLLESEATADDANTQTGGSWVTPASCLQPALRDLVYYKQKTTWRATTWPPASKQVASRLTYFLSKRETVYGCAVTVDASRNGSGGAFYFAVNGVWKKAASLGFDGSTGSALTNSREDIRRLMPAVSGRNVGASMNINLGYRAFKYPYRGQFSPSMDPSVTSEGSIPVVITECKPVLVLGSRLPPPVLAAATAKQFDCCRVLLEKTKRPEDLNFQNPESGKTLLHMAVENEMHDIAVGLVDSGLCRLDLRDVDGNTVLHTACKLPAPMDEQTYQLVKKLVGKCPVIVGGGLDGEESRGSHKIAKPGDNTTNNGKIGKSNAWTPFQLAVKHRHHKVVEHMLKAAQRREWTMTTANLVPALVMVSHGSQGDPELVKLLLRYALTKWSKETFLAEISDPQRAEDLVMKAVNSFLQGSTDWPKKTLAWEDMKDDFKEVLQVLNELILQLIATHRN